MSAEPPKSTIIKEELEFFKSVSEVWWNEDGIMKTLHTMNEIRVPEVKQILFSTGVVDPKFTNTTHPLRGIKFLDVGCGGGLMTEALAKLGGEVLGIDPATELINVAKYHASLDASLTNLEYLVTTIEEFSEQNEGKFDCVVCSEVLEHITEPELMLKSCAKCLKPNGSMYITTYNKTFTAKFFGIWGSEYVFNIIPRGAHSYDLFISPEEVTRILEKYNCKTKEVKGFFVSYLTGRWYWTSPSVHYGLHAIKNT